MNQCLNILRKDVWQLWPQMVTPMMALILFTLLEPTTWGGGPPLVFSTEALTRVLVLLFCMSWIVLTISLVQAERMVGLNQFWTTRPYEWPKLIAAKGLFVLAWLYLPLAVAQVILLWRAHLPVLGSIPAVVLNLLLLTAAFVLPVVCVAAVTRSIAQAMVVLMIVFAALSVAGTLSALFATLAPRSLVAVQMGIVAAAFVAALVNQYRSRKTGRSLWIMALAPALTMMLQLTVPGTPLSAGGYAQATNDAGLTVRFDDNPLRVFGSYSASVQDRRGPLRSFGRSLLGVRATMCFCISRCWCQVCSRERVSAWRGID